MNRLSLVTYLPVPHALATLIMVVAAVGVGCERETENLSAPIAVTDAVTAARGHLAIALDTDPDGRPRAATVLAGGPSEQAGVEDGDVILSVGGDAVRTLQELTSRLSRTKPGEVVNVELRRGAETKTVEVRLIDFVKVVQLQPDNH